MREYHHTGRVSSESGNRVLFFDGNFKCYFSPVGSRILKTEVIQYELHNILLAYAKDDEYDFDFISVPGFLIVDKWRQDKDVKVSLVEPVESHWQQEKIKKFLKDNYKLRGAVYYFWSY